MKFSVFSFCCTPWYFMLFVLVNLFFFRTVSLIGAVHFHDFPSLRIFRQIRNLYRSSPERRNPDESSPKKKHLPYFYHRVLKEELSKSRSTGGFALNLRSTWKTNHRRLRKEFLLYSLVSLKHNWSYKLSLFS